MSNPDNNKFKWQLLNNSKKELTEKDIIKILLKNREISWGEKNVFFKPQSPKEITLKELGIKKTQIDKTIKRIKKAKEKNEKVIIFGDYDADGVCATAILWEHLFAFGLDVLPYIPDRFTQGYGLSKDGIDDLLDKQKVDLIITVDNGIVANDAISYVNKKKIDVIVTDHHQKGKALPKAHALIHTDKISGSAISWILAREIVKDSPKLKDSLPNGNGLDLCAIGTVADQIALVGVNRSFVKHGLVSLNETTRVGLLELFKNAKIEVGNITTYSINFVIAPRINAMGRLSHAIDSLRLLCTRKQESAMKLADTLNKTNVDRQKIVGEVLIHVHEQTKDTDSCVIVVADGSYHEGVIGLAAARLVDKYYRPAIVISLGKKISKGSARSITGFNMIKNIRKLDKIIDQGGGHPMAADLGFK